MLITLLVMPLSADNQNSIPNRNRTVEKSSLAMADVPHDAIPDTIWTKNEMIIGVIIGFFPKSPIAEPRLKYRAVESGRIKKIHLSKLVQVSDGQSGRLIDLPGFFERHETPIVGGVLLLSCIGIPILYLILFPPQFGF